MSTQTPTIRKAYADTSYGQIHYRYIHPSSTTLQNPSTLLFLHKSASSSASFDLLMLTYAAKGYPCYAPDMPGFGGSFDPTDEQIKLIRATGTAWFVSVFMEAFAFIGIKNAHIMGHHSGAVLATEIAAVHPDFAQSICMVGPTIMSAEERVEMKKIYFNTFNEPVVDGSHLMKTWEYLGGMGIGGDLVLWQRELIDHVRAWKGRNLIYGGVWMQEAEELYSKVKCGILLTCAKDDVLWKYFDHVKGLNKNAKFEEIKGGNFEPDRDVEGLENAWTKFLNDIDDV